MNTSSRALRLARIGLFSLAASALLYNASCSSGGQTGSTSGGDAENPELADVIYQGSVTDEALEELLAGKNLQQGMRAPVIDTPMNNSALPAATAPSFTWHVGSAAGGALRPMTPPSLRLAPATSPSRARWMGSELAALLGPERVASAHGAPFSGTAYWLVFSTDSDSKLLRVFTDKNSYQPDATAWTKLKSAGKPVNLVILAGWFDLNKLTSDGGPYAGEPVTFTITP